MSTNDTYVDVSHEFEQAVRDIPNGQTVAFSMFKLFDAVSTFEIGDPKFDTETTRSQQPFSAYDVTQDLTPSEVLEIMYQIFRLQSTWISGCVMSQSIFTCHYIHNLLRNCDQVFELQGIQFQQNGYVNRHNGPLEVLRCYSILVIKVLWAVNSMLKRSRIPSFEEGDHIWQTHDQSLFQRIEVKRVLIEMALDLLDSLVEEHMRELGEPARALIFLQWDFLLALTSPGRIDDNYGFNSFNGYLEIIQQHCTALDHDENRHKKSAFDSDLSEKYPPLTPPRLVTPHSISKLGENFTQIRNECRSIISDIIIGDLAAPENILALKQYLIMRNIEHCHSDVFIRTFSYWSISTAAEPAWTDRILHDIWQTTLYAHPAFEAEATDSEQDPRREMYRQKLSFMTMYQALFGNRSRMRRDFIRTIRGLENFKRMAAEFDNQLTDIGGDSPSWGAVPTGLLDWVHMNQLWLAQSVVELGFEQGIYDYTEYDYLIRYLLLVLIRREGLLEHYFPRTSDDFSRPSTVNSKPDTQSLRNFYSAFCRAELGLYNEAHLIWKREYTSRMLPQQPDGPYPSERQWSLRMKPFKTLTDPPLQLELPRHLVELPPASVQTLMQSGRDLAQACSFYVRDLVKHWDTSTKKYPFFAANFTARKVLEVKDTGGSGSQFPLRT